VLDGFDLCLPGAVNGGCKDAGGFLWAVEAGAVLGRDEILSRDGGKRSSKN